MYRLQNGCLIPEEKNFPLLVVRHFAYINSFYSMMKFYYSTLEMRKLRHREAKQLAQDHTTSKCQNWDSDPNN
jgi:hypothetical protein